MVCYNKGIQLIPVYIQSILDLSTSCFIVVTLRLQPPSKLQTNVWKSLPQLQTPAITDCRHFIWCQTNTLLWEVIIDWLMDNFIELKYYSVVLEFFTVFYNSVVWSCTTVNAWNVCYKLKNTGILKECSTYSLHMWYVTTKNTWRVIFITPCFLLLWTANDSPESVHFMYVARIDCIAYQSY